MAYRSPVRSPSHASASASIAMASARHSGEQLSLFWQPGQRGFYAPRPSPCNEARLNLYRNVGRLANIDLHIFAMHPLMCGLQLSTKFI